MVIFKITIGILLIVSFATVVYVVVHAEQMSDKEREEIGHGPRGQGR